MIRNSKTCNGFTLIELVVVIAILGVMAAIGLPSLINSRYKLNKAARDLVSDMHTTRMGAIKNNQDWAIVFDFTANGYHICSDPGSDDVWSTITGAGTANTIVKSVYFTGYSAGVTYGNGPATTNATVGGGAFPGNFNSYSFSAAYPNINVLTFNSQGTCASGFVYLTYSDLAYAAGTLSTGVIRLKTWAQGAWK